MRFSEAHEQRRRSLLDDKYEINKSFSSNVKTKRRHFDQEYPRRFKPRSVNREKFHSISCQGLAG